MQEAVQGDARRVKLRRLNITKHCARRQFPAIRPAPSAASAVADLFSLEEYHRRRATFRAEVLAHNRDRQPAIGPHVTRRISCARATPPRARLLVN
jgi:hypothetical protein